MGNCCCDPIPLEDLDKEKNLLGNDGRLDSKIDVTKVSEERAPIVALELEAKRVTKYRRRKKTFEPAGNLDFTKDPEVWDLRNLLDEPVGRFYLREYCEKKEQVELGKLVDLWIAIFNLKDNEEATLKELLSKQKQLDEEAEKAEGSNHGRPNSLVAAARQEPLKGDVLKMTDVLLNTFLRGEKAKEIPIDDELKMKTLENAERALESQDVKQLQDKIFLEIQNEAIQLMAQRKLYSEFTEHSEYARYKYKFAKIYNKITHKDFDYMQHLGRGSFGRVLRVRKKTTGRMYAMKVMAKRRIMDGAENSSQVTIERKVMVMCNHRNIVKAYFCFQTSRALFLVMELLEGGNLEDCRARLGGKIPVDIVRFQSAQIILALAHMHHHGILYRDLKPVNVMLDRYGNTVLTDLGLCAKFRASKFPKDTGGRTVTGAKMDSRKSMKIVPPHKLKCVGTMHYRAPELLQASETKEGYGPEVDYFALGVTMYYLITGGNFPYRSKAVFSALDGIGDNKKLERKYQQNRPKYEKEFKDPNLASLLQGMLLLQPSERLGRHLEELQDHPFYKTIDWDKLEEGKLKPLYVPVVKEHKAKEAPIFDNLHAALTQFSADNILELFGGENEMNLDYKHVKEKHQKYFKDWDFTPDFLLEEDWREAELQEQEQEQETIN